MPSIWGPKRERQYRHILEACLAKPTKCKTQRCKTARVRNCKSMAGATVNRDRSRFCETKAGCPARR